MSEKIFEKTSIKNEKKADLFKDDHEHIIDIELPEIKTKIEQAKELFRSFFEKYKQEFDLSDHTKIENVIKAAEKEGIFDKAKEIRELIFDKNISIYGVCYLSNECDQNCKFCPMGQTNWEKWIYEQDFSSFKETLDDSEKLKALARRQFNEQEMDKIRSFESEFNEEEKEEMNKSLKEQTQLVLEIWDKEISKLNKKFKTLELSEAQKDIESLSKIGHKEICILSGEKISFDPIKVVEYTQIAVNTPGVKEVILNMGSYSENIFKWIKDNLQIPEGVKLQHRVFQETYDRDEYNYYMEKSGSKNTTDGKIFKRDFEFRYNSQVAAIKAGFDEVGIGALFGLSRYPLEEIAGLQKHSDYIKEQTGKEPKRCCLPLANQPENEKHVDIKYMITSMKNQKNITELIYALARLAMPTISIVSSERDAPETLEILDQYANHSTLFVHPAPGENMQSIKEIQEKKEPEHNTKPVGQAETYPRKPEEALASWYSRGYNITGFDFSK